MSDRDQLQAVRIDLIAALERVEGLLHAADNIGSGQVRDVDIIGLDRTKAIEWVLNRRGEAMRPIEIWAELRRQGRDDPKMEVQVTTFDLWKRDRIGKVGRGLYIANGHRWSPPVPRSLSGLQ